MQDEGYIAVGAPQSDPACAAMQRRRDSAPVEEQDRLAAVLGDRAKLGEQRRRQRIAGLAAEVDDPHGRERPGKPAAELEAFERPPALRARRRAPEDRDGAFQRRTL